ncbi:MAG: DNA-directed RNA polymerase subunit D [Nitrososphaerota archaeon]
MQVSIIEEDDKRIKLSLRDVPLSIVNALRRIIINEVPVMAVDDVLIIENTSSMMNEVLAYRISLIPYVTDLENYKLPEECDCKSAVGCEKCTVRFSLKAVASDSVITVYSRDIQPVGETGKVRPINGDFPIIKLAPNQAIELELYVRLGKGKKHAKWQPGIATLSYDDKGKYLFVESFGFLEPRRIILEAVKIFEETLTGLNQAIIDAIRGEKNEEKDGKV